MSSARWSAAQAALEKYTKSTELVLTRKVHDYLTRLYKKERKPVWFIKTRGGPMQRAGLPDYILCINGRFGALELKNPRDENPKPTPAQRLQLREIHRSGGFSWVMNDYQQIVLAIETILAMPPITHHVGDESLYAKARWDVGVSHR